MIKRVYQVWLPAVVVAMLSVQVGYADVVVDPTLEPDPGSQPSLLLGGVLVGIIALASLSVLIAIRKRNASASGQSIDPAARDPDH
ncbi:MAG: hypothetical protein JXA89_06285 [Anaerolineae bacterium]|nr:hypothetical protein [Anaerolineae bacterium]